MWEKKQMGSWKMEKIKKEFKDGIDIEIIWNAWLEKTY